MHEAAARVEPDADEPERAGISSHLVVARTGDHEIDRLTFPVT